MITLTLSTQQVSRAAASVLCLSTQDAFRLCIECRSTVFLAVLGVQHKITVVMRVKRKKIRLKCENTLMCVDGWIDECKSTSDPSKVREMD